MNEETMTIKSPDGRWFIEQERIDEFDELYTITVYKDGRSIFSTTRKEKETYGELTTTLISCIRMFG